MNQKLVVGIAAFLAGSLAGSLVTWKLIDKKYASYAEEEIESVKRRWAKRQEKVYSEMAAHYGVDLEEGVEVVEEEKVKYPSILGRSSLDGQTPIPNAIEQAKIDYDKMHSGSKNQQKNSDEDVDLDEPDSEAYIHHDPKPCVITEKSYSEEYLHHDKATITYYAEDNVLIDEDESIMDDIDNTIGWDNLDLRHADITHPHTIFVRNENYGIDYEIIINLSSYAEQILGTPLRPQSPRELQRARAEKRKRGYPEYDE